MGAGPVQEDHDYRSPNLERIDLAFAFPQRIVGDKASSAWPYLRRDVSHNWYVDSRNPTVGFVSDDEVAILYNSAKLSRGRPCLEIGCWRGWSTAHIAKGSGNLEVIDPVLLDPVFLADVQASMERAGVLENIIFHPDMSPRAVREISQASGKRWAFAFIDGDHDGAAPRRDAEVVSEYMADTALVLFHDLASPFVADGLAFFADSGWNTKIYQTMQIMGVAWRGDIEPVDHIPDPAITWALPAHLERFGSGLPNSSGPSRCDTLDTSSSVIAEPAKKEEGRDRYPELFQKFLELLEKYTIARGELNAKSEQNQLLEKRVVASSQEIAAISQALAEQVGRSAGLEASLVDFVNSYQKKEGDYREQLARTEADRLRALEESKRLREALAQAASGQADQAARYAKLETRLDSWVNSQMSQNLALREQGSRLIRVSQRFEERLEFERSSQVFANWAASPRTLFGLARRRVLGSAEAAIQLVYSEARAHMLSEDVACSVSQWLPRRRVVVGLLRRTFLGGRFAARDTVVENLRASAPTPESSVTELAGALGILSHEITGDLGADGPTSVRDQEAQLVAAKAIETLEAEVKRLRPYEIAKLEMDAVITDLRVELAVLRHQVGAKSEGKV